MTDEASKGEQAPMPAPEKDREGLAFTVASALSDRRALISAEICEIAGLYGIDLRSPPNLLNFGIGRKALDELDVDVTGKLHKSTYIYFDRSQTPRPGEIQEAMQRIDGRNSTKTP